MRFGLYIFRFDEAADYSAGKRFRFAVVDLDRGKDYPLNFICMLPTKMNGNAKSQPVFQQIFGDKSMEQAVALLTRALETEDNAEVKAEVTRRLRELEPNPTSQIKCCTCGKLFQSRRVEGFKQKFCQECVKKFGSRE